MLPIIKINTLGGTGSGKTSIVETLHDRWNGLTTSTLGVGIQEPLAINFSRQLISSTTEEKDVFDAKFVVWDLGGQTKYRDLLNDFLPGSYGQIGVVDGLNPRSVESLIVQLFLSVQIVNSSIPLVILVTKRDLYEGLRQVAVIDEFEAINLKIASTIIEALSIIEYPNNTLNPISGQDECLINYWILETAVIHGLGNKMGIKDLISQPIEVILKTGQKKTIDLKNEFGLDNLKLLSRYILIFLLKPEKKALFEGKISELLPQIEFDRPGLIKPDNEKRKFLIDTFAIKKLVQQYQGNPEPTLRWMMKTIVDCYSGSQQVLQLKAVIPKLPIADIQSLAKRYGQRLTEEQVTTLKRWIFQAKFFEVTMFESFFIKNILLDFFRDVFNNKANLDAQMKEMPSKEDLARILAVKRRSKGM